MVNFGPPPPPPPPPPSSDLQKDREALKQLGQRWNNEELRAKALFQEQEDAHRFLTNQSLQSFRRNEDLRALNRDNRSLADKVSALQKAIDGQEITITAPAPVLATTPTPTPTNIKTKKKKASSQSSSDPKAEAPKPSVEAPKELPPIPQLDLGCRFVPTDQELIICLRKKMLGEALPKFIIERDLYATEEPKHLFKNNLTASEMYFFTPIKVKFDSGKRADRIVGSGTWKLQNNRDVFEDPNTKKNVIGCKRTLNFIETKGEGKSDSWIMHEYVLKEKDQGRWAVCRVKRGRGNFVGLSAPEGPLYAYAPMLISEKGVDQSSGKGINMDQSSGKGVDDDMLELDLKL